MVTVSPLCRYAYDAIDRLARRSFIEHSDEQSFYQENRLSTEIRGQVRHSWLQVPQQLLAQLELAVGDVRLTLIATDLQGSVLQGISASRQQGYRYTAYGNRHPVADPLYLPGFNRELPDAMTGCYLLGNGYRAFNPQLMRFNSPDNESPFGKGGLNAYAYCSGNPVGRVDRDGHAPTFVNSFLRTLGLKKASKVKLPASLAQASKISEPAPSAPMLYPDPSAPPASSATLRADKAARKIYDEYIAAYPEPLHSSDGDLYFSMRNLDVKAIESKIRMESIMERILYSMYPDRLYRRNKVLEVAQNVLLRTSSASGYHYLRGHYSLAMDTHGTNLGAAFKSLNLPEPLVRAYKDYYKAYYDLRSL